MNNDIQNLVNELNSTTPKTQMYMIQLCRSAINNLYDLTDTIEENISSLQTSVVANTSAISGLQGSIDLINTNLNAYLGRIEALEDKTTNMSKLGNDTKFSNNVNVDGIITTGDDIISDGVIKGQVLVADNDQGEGRFAIDSDGDMSLYNPANAGKLITSGNISEYASGSYTHLIKISIDRIIKFNCNQSTPFTLESFAQYLYNKNIRIGGNSSPVNIIDTSISSTENSYYLGVYSSNGVDVYYNRENGAGVQITSITDNVYTL